MDSCPFCNSDDGYYFKNSYKGNYEERYTFDNKIDDISDMHEGDIYTKGKVAYCRNCNKKLFKRDL